MTSPVLRAAFPLITPWRVLMFVASAFASPANATETITYSYDAVGRLVGVSHNGAVNQGAIATYQYDKADNRTQVTMISSVSSRALRTGDFNGDGRDDILWRNDTSFSTPGVVSDWLSSSTGGWIDNWGNSANTAGELNWKVAGVGDFNGDGRSDILWRYVDGTVTNWLGGAAGGFTGNWANFHVNPGSMWRIVGIGDFNGDGRDDVVLRADDGTITDWLGQAAGDVFHNWGNFNVNPGAQWNVVGTGDFNGDGRDDMLLRADDGTVTDWLGQPAGDVYYNWYNFNTNVSHEWQIVATGDFNGDGRADILWRRDNGVMIEWQGTASGAFTQAPLGWNVSTDYHVAAIGNFNGPGGSDDILWRNRAGDLVQWLGTSTGDFIGNNAASNSVGTEWSVEPRPSGGR